MQELLHRVKLQDLLAVYDHHRHREVKDHILIAFEEEDLPYFVEKAELDNPGVEGHHPLRRVHLDNNLSLAQVHQELFVLVA